MNWYEKFSLVLTGLNIAAFIVLTYWLVRQNKKIGQAQVDGQKRELKIQLYKYRFEVYKGVNKFIKLTLLDTDAEHAVEVVYHILYGLCGHIEEHDHKTKLPYSVDFREFEEHVTYAKSLFPADVYQKLDTFRSMAFDFEALLTALKAKYYIIRSENINWMDMIMPVLLEKSLNFPPALNHELRVLVVECAKMYRNLYQYKVNENIPDILEQYVDIKHLDV